MKKVLITGLIVALSLLIIPLGGIENKKEVVQTLSPVKAVEKAEESYQKQGDGDFSFEDVDFRIKTADGVITLGAKEYITGVVSAEMPTDFNIEALKAQCVAAYSFALYRKEANKTKEYDLTDSYKTDQSYLSEEKRKEKWGEAYESKVKKTEEAITATAGEYLSYDKKPALTLYHALSPGVTNSCADVFGSDLPYLISVDSESDRLCPDYKSVFSFSTEDITKKLSSIEPANNSGENLFSDIKTSKGGLVKSLKYSGTDTSGGTVAGLLELPSAAFTVNFLDSGYTFTCLGHGHGVGMSQYGANALAESGADYREILSHFYPGTQLMKN